MKGIIKMDKIKMKRSKNADTRTAEGNVSKELLLDNTLSHIEDVQHWGYVIADLLKKQVLNHDIQK